MSLEPPSPPAPRLTDMGSAFRVLHVIASVDPRHGGPIEGVLRQAGQRREGAVTIVSLDAPDEPWVAACPVPTIALGLEGDTWRRLRRRLPWLRYGYTPRLVPWLRHHARHYDLVVVNGLWNYAALGARRALVGSGMPYVVFTHGMLDPWFRRTYPLKHLVKQALWWVSEGPLLAHAGAVLFTSEDERRLAEGVFRPYRLEGRVVGYGTADLTGDAAAQVAAFWACVPALRHRPFLLYLSRIHPKKGCDLLIEAFAAAARAHPELDLVLAGPDQTGWVPALQRRAEALGIGTRVHWPGMLEGDAKWGAFRSCTAFVLPSHQENFGIVVAEAMAAGRPVLITDKVNIWREIEADGAGLVAADDKAGVAALLEEFLAMAPDERDAMGARARASFLARFEIGRAVASMLAAMREVASA